MTLESTRRDPVVACWTLSAQGPHPGHTRSPADVSGIAFEVVPADLDRRELAHFVLTTMEGGVMQARTFRKVAYFDDAVHLG